MQSIAATSKDSSSQQTTQFSALGTPQIFPLSGDLDPKANVANDLYFGFPATSYSNFMLDESTRAVAADESSSDDSSQTIDSDTDKDSLTLADFMDTPSNNLANMPTPGMTPVYPVDRLPPPAPPAAGQRPLFKGVRRVTGQSNVPPPPMPPTEANGKIPMSMCGEVDLSEMLRRRRLARKAELARLSRKRKKERLSELEVQVVNLQSELEQIRKRRKVDLETIKQFQKAQNNPSEVQPKVVTVIEPAIETSGKPSASSELRTAMKLIANAMGADNGASLSQLRLMKLIDGFTSSLSKMDHVSEKHLEDLVQASDVPLPIRFLQWAMSQDDAFFTEKDGLWAGLFDKIGSFSNQQMHSLLTLRSRMKAQRELYDKVLHHSQMHREALKQLHVTSLKNFDDIRGIFTERQLAKYFVWVEANQLCMKMIMTQK